MALLFEVLKHSEQAIAHYLQTFAFPLTLESTLLQLTASGQELAGVQLFRHCVGFSGTPNDLLPRNLGDCCYAKLDDGKLLTTLSDPSIAVAANILKAGSWTARTVLDSIHTKDHHALIDTGALVTGMTNLEAAEYLLFRRLDAEIFKGVVYLNEKHERVVLLRDGKTTIPFDQCGLGKGERFSFYDHVHTTGMDIKQSLLARAVITLGKDMTLRDFAQGAYRMRGIGKGQTLVLLVPGEVESLIFKAVREVVPCVGGAAAEESRRRKHQTFLVQVLVWLALNGISLEEKQMKLLLQQSLRNVWKLDAAKWITQKAVFLARDHRVKSSKPPHIPLPYHVWGTMTIGTGLDAL